MSKSNSFETQLLQYVFNATAFPWDANTNLYVSLHTSDPGEAGDQTTNEANYTGYARIAVARTSGGWTVSGNLGENAAKVTFPACTGGSNTVTHFGIGTTLSAAGTLLYSGALSASLAVSNGITPEAAINALQVTED